MSQLKSDDYPAYFKPYIDTVGHDVMLELTNQLESFPAFLKTVPAGKTEFSYAEGKWTIKEVVGHIIDTERIMAYRLLRFARNDSTELMGFAEENYVLNARFNEFSLIHYAEEFVLLRKSNLILFASLNEHELGRKGMASERLISVRALLYVIAGHLNHHRNIIQERYLKE